MAEFLISRGASVTRSDAYGRTALHWACWKGNAAMVRFLIQRGADVNACEHEGITPLHWAIEESQWHELRSLAVIKALVENGADLNATNSQGATALRHARKYGTDAIRAHLMSKNAPE